MEERSFEHELKIEDDYRVKENKKQRYFFPLNQETNFRINKFLELLPEIKKINKSLNIKGRNFEIKNYYEGISRFDFKDLSTIKI